MTRNQLAVKSHLAFATIDEIENGARKPRCSTIKKLAIALHYDYVKLYDEIEEEYYDKRRNSEDESIRKDDEPHK